MTPTAKPLVKAATVKRARKAAPAIAAEVVVRMDQTLPWFGVMSPNQRSWVGLVVRCNTRSKRTRGGPVCHVVRGINYALDRPA